MKILDEVKGASSIAIGGHIRPDGDCVGSCLAMWNYLVKTMPDAEVTVYLEEPPAIFDVINGVDRVLNEADPLGKPDVFICIDCNEDRLGFSGPLFRNAGKRINIDHHVSNPGCGDVNYIYPDASSAAELVYEVMDRDLIDEEIAKAVYIGIIHDTGVLKYSSTSPKTLRIAADLISFGFDFTKLIDETFYEKTYVQSQILGRSLMESIIFMDGKCVVSMVDRKTMDFYRADSADLDGIVSQLLLIKDVECAIFMHEQRPMEYKVSLRARNKLDVSVVAEAFGGGGHKKAAGCTMNGTYYDCINNLSYHIEQQLI
ncbi:MAG: DHH family phosphoesterase [Lachnospiraceae bacterium]|nr:DHH family phosphoesterase [Lachnospiraceae bacterium]